MKIPPRLHFNSETGALRLRYHRAQYKISPLKNVLSARCNLRLETLRDEQRSCEVNHVLYYFIFLPPFFEAGYNCWFVKCDINGNRANFYIIIMFRVLTIGSDCLLHALFCIQAENAQKLTSRISETRPGHVATSSLHCVLLTQTRATSWLRSDPSLRVFKHYLPTPKTHILCYICNMSNSPFINVLNSNSGGALACWLLL